MGSPNPPPPSVGPGHDILAPEPGTRPETTWTRATSLSKSVEEVSVDATVPMGLSKWQMAGVAAVVVALHMYPGAQI